MWFGEQVKLDAERAYTSEGEFDAFTDGDLWHKDLFVADGVVICEVFVDHIDVDGFMSKECEFFGYIPGGIEVVVEFLPKETLSTGFEFDEDIWFGCIAPTKIPGGAAFFGRRDFGGEDRDAITQGFLCVCDRWGDV